MLFILLLKDIFISLMSISLHLKKLIMKKIFFSLLILISITVFSVKSQTIKAITYNLRYENTFDGENSWKFRKDKITEMFNFYNADIIGIQEGLISQIIYIDSSLNQYQHVGIGRDDGKTLGEYSAVFYKKDKFDIIQSSTFWLSETPDTVSKGWDAACNRICTYALLKDKNTHQFFWVFNTNNY